MCKNIKKYHEKVEESQNTIIEEKSNLKGDYGNFALLLKFYYLQGVIIGLTVAIPYILQSKGVSYKNQALFTICHYPYALKIFWSPIVDSLYFSKFGRRKSWIVPFQFLTGLTLLLSGNKVNKWIGNESGNVPDVISLTIVFTALRTFAATQDIAVDGWALTLLKKRNVGHIATADTIGYVAGFYFTVVSLLVLESKEFCNKFIFSESRDQGLITVGGFSKFWGVIFILSSLFVILFIHENAEQDKELKKNPDYGVKKAYPTLLKIIKLKPVMRLMIFLLTARVTFGAKDAMSFLKLMEYGVPKESMAPLAILAFPFLMLFTALISRYTTGRYPMKFYMQSFKIRMMLMVLTFVMIYMSAYIIGRGDSISIPWFFYIILFVFFLAYQCYFRAMYVADIAFFARVADPLVGGTYLTLLNTVGNFGVKWPQSFSLWLVDFITWKRCIFDENSFTNSTGKPVNFLLDNKCESREKIDICTTNGGRCYTNVDGFYIEALFSVIYGIIFYKIGKRIVNSLEELPIDDWHILSKKEIEPKIEEEKEILCEEVKEKH